MFPVLLDANVLFPNYLRDLILTLASGSSPLFTPLWSERILAEVRRNILAQRGVDETMLDRTLARMNAAFPGAVVTGFEPLETGLELSDPDDRHVLAAAITGNVQTLVTANLKDFPADKLTSHGIEAVHPDVFLLDQLDLVPPEVFAALGRMRARFKNPPMDLDGLLTRLERCGVPDFADEVRRRRIG